MSFRLRITFLGTSATFPTKNRNHPGIFVEFLNEGILLDCGEGIQRQFRKAGISTTKITKILITHLHGDHFLGIPGIFQSLINSNYNKILEIYGPIGLKDSLSKIFEGFMIYPNFKYKIYEIEPSDHVFKIYENKHYELFCTSCEHSIKTLAFSFKEKDILKLDANKLRKLGIIKHPLLGKLKQGYEVKIGNKILDPREYVYTKKGFKVTYITDTLFKENLVELAQDSDVLVIEAMYSKKDKELALEHMHLSIEDTLKIAKLSNSKITFLVHISQRYEEDLSQILNDIDLPENVFIAYDFDQITYVKNKIYVRNNNREYVFERDEKTGKVSLIS